MISLSVAMFGRARTVVNLSRRAFRGYKWSLIALAALGILGTLLEAIGVNALIPLFSFFSGETSSPPDFISAKIENLFGLFHIEFSLPNLLILIVLLFFLKACASVYINYIKLSIKTAYERNTMEKLFRSTLAANWSYLLKQKLGYLETVLVIDVQKTANLLFALSNLITMLTSFFVYLFIAMTISQTVTLFSVGVGIVVFFVFLPLLRRAKRVAQETVGLNKEIAHRVNESIAGLKVLKAMAVEDRIGDISASLFSSLRKLRIRAGLLEQALTAFIQPIGVALIALIVLFSYYYTSYNLGALIAVIYLVNRMFGNIQEMQGKLHGISGAVPYVESVLSYEEQTTKNQEIQHNKASFSFQKNITFTDVSFTYGDNVPTLQNVSLSVPHGSVVGVTGPSGSGKTTFFDLLLRLFEPTSGSITLDGKDISSINLLEWRKNIAYVSQDTFLLNGTIKDNIRFYDETITDTQVEQAVRSAQLVSVIQKLPRGIDTMVGERGVELSGGQRQRIAIARAFARGAQVLLLDEATSALDKEMEVSIQEIVNSFGREMTVFIISHQASLFEGANFILVFEGGRLVEKGDPIKMLKNKNSYLHKISI